MPTPPPSIACGCALCQAPHRDGTDTAATPPATPVPEAPVPEAQAFTTSGRASVDALLALSDAGDTARWNFAQAVGTPAADPGGLGLPAAVTYSFMATAPAYAADAASPGFAPFTDIQREAARAALAQYAAVAGLSFTEVADTGAGGQIRFGTHPMDGIAGYAYYPSFGYTVSGTPDMVTGVEELAIGGDVWLAGSVDNRAPAPGGYGYLTLLHEIGHALGLKHPFTASPVLPEAEDTHRHTVMSYNAPADSGLVLVTGDAGGYQWRAATVHPRTPMPLDIAALRHLYGEAPAVRTGDDTYAWQPGEPFFETLWDGGGTDTIDLSNQTLPNAVDLRPGTFSSVALRLTEADRRLGIPDWAVDAPTPGYDGTDTLAIAAGTVIENAVGGAGHDRITGNDAANLLRGNAGNDTLFGGAGDDTLDGGTGTDLLDGGAGDDRALFAVARDAAEVRADGADLIVAGAGGVARLRGVETLVFTDRAIAAADALQPLPDTTPAPVDPGRRALVSDASGSREVAMDPYAGPVAWLENQYLGQPAGEAVIGGARADFFNLLGGDDAADGAGGDDVLDGGTGSNFLTGGAGTDTFFVDGRGGGATWSTVTDLETAEWAIVWGWRAGASRLAWAGTAGAPGAEGATAHADLDADGIIDVSLTAAGHTADSLLALPGLSGADGYLAILLA